MAPVLPIYLVLIIKGASSGAVERVLNPYSMRGPFYIASGDRTSSWATPCTTDQPLRSGAFRRMLSVRGKFTNGNSLQLSGCRLFSGVPQIPGGDHEKPKDGAFLSQA